MWIKAMTIRDPDTNRWWIVEWTNGVYMAVTEINFPDNHNHACFQGDDCHEPLEEWDKLGPLEFLDWFYDMEYDLAFGPMTDDRLETMCERLNINMDNLRTEKTEGF